MKKYNIENLEDILKNTNEKTVLFGAGVIGEICLYAMKQKGINIDFFCDSSKRKQGKQHYGIKIISPEELGKLHLRTNIFFSNN